MLSSVLGSETAVDMNIRIMRAFTASQQIMENHAILYKRVVNLEHHDIKKTSKPAVIASLPFLSVRSG
jgi:hypothetical protein